MIELSSLVAALTLDNEQYMKSLGQSLDEGQSVVDQMGHLGGAIVFGGLAAGAAAIGAVGAAAWSAAESYDAAFDSIAVKTGATGAELEALKINFKDVFVDVPADAQQVADVLGTLSSRLHISGTDLSGLSTQMLQLSQITGGDATASAELFSRVMQDATIPTERAAASLDVLFAASQQTGAPLDQLMQRMVQFGAPMRQFGFNFIDSAALLSKWEAEGVNTELVMGSLRIAAGKFADKGVDMKKGLWDTIDAIKKAKSSTEALTLATDTFGARAAVDMIDTIRNGKFDIYELTNTLWDTGHVISKTALATEDWGETWKRFTHQLTDALAPMGDQLRSAAQGGINTLMNLFQRPEVQSAITQFTDFAVKTIGQIVTYIPVLIDSFFKFIEFLKNNQGVVVTILAVIGTAVAAWVYTTVIPAAIAAITAMAPLLLTMAAIAAVAYVVYEAWTNNWGGIRDTLTALWNGSLKPALTQLWNWLQVNIPAALQWLSNLWTNTLLPALTAVWQFLQTYVFPLLSAVANVIGAVLGKALQGVGAYLMNVWIPNFMKGFNWIRDNVLPVIQVLTTWLGTKLAPAFSGIANAISKVVSWLGTLANKISALHLPSWLTPGSPTPWENGLWGVQEALQSVAHTSLPDFQAAVALSPLAPAAGGIDLAPSSAAVSTATNNSGRGSEAGNDLLLKDVQRLLRDLPKEIARVNRDSSLRAAA